jgi:hypothetical protein
MRTDVPRLLTVHDVANLLHMLPRRVIRLAREGKISHVVMPDGDLVFDESDLAAWINEQRVPAKPQAEGMAAK